MTTTQLPVFSKMQLLKIETTNSVFEIAAVTDKAIMIKCDDGKWGGNGFKPMWIPKSLIFYVRFNDSRENSQHGIHVVDLPAWFIHKNSKVL